MKFIKLLLKRIYNHCFSRGFFSYGKNNYISPPAYFLNKSLISLGSNIIIGRCSRIEVYPQSHNQQDPIIEIGENVNINWYCHVGAINKIIIRNNVLIGSNVCIIDHFHGKSDNLDSSPLTRPLYSKGQILIEENCWIGENVVILPNITVGRNSIVGANSVVTKDIPPFSVYAGNPARKIK